MSGSSFRYNGYAYVGNVSVDFQIDSRDALEDIGEEFVEQWLTEQRGWSPERSDPVAILLEDPVKRLEVVTALRGQGYVVEPN